jgi:signal recognition particle subunit SRP54
MIKEICNEIMEDDVNIMIVKKMRENVSEVIDFDEMEGGMKKRRMIKSEVFKELVKIVDKGVKDNKKVKGKKKIIMFVGMKGYGKKKKCKKLE